MVRLPCDEVGPHEGLAEQPVLTVHGSLEGVPVAVDEHVGAVDPCELLVELEVTGLVPGAGGRIGHRSTMPHLRRDAVGTEPHQGVGGRDRPHVRVVEGVRPVTDLGHLLDPDDPPREEGVHRRAIVTARVVRLGDRHITSIT